MRRLILLPGLGADARLFAPQAAAFGRLEVPEWIAPHEGESLESFARRMAETVHPTDEYVLGGVSFGGMVASEMSRHLRPPALLLIASATSGSAIPSPLPFVQWGLEALLRWKPASTLAVPLFHIHGSADRLIPSHRVRPTLVVPGAGHLINLTHADEVNRFLRLMLERASPHRCNV